MAFQNGTEMDQQFIASLRSKAGNFCRQALDWLLRLPPKGKVVLGLCLLAAILMALHTALSGSDASLHLAVQHNFRSADLSVWIDDELAYSGTLAGSTRRKLGLIPSSVQGTLSEILPISRGKHQLRVRVVSEDGSTQQDTIAGDFARNTERELSVNARPIGLSLAWRATTTSASSSGSNWFERYAGAMFLTIGGSIISALTGIALKELPKRIRGQGGPAEMSSPE